MRVPVTLPPLAGSICVSTKSGPYCNDSNVSAVYAYATLAEDFLHVICHSSRTPPIFPHTCEFFLCGLLLRLTLKEDATRPKQPHLRPQVFILLALAFPALFALALFGHPLLFAPPRSRSESAVKFSRCRQFGRLALTDRSVGQGRYGQSVRFHLRDNTVDIEGRFGS